MRWRFVLYPAIRWLGSSVARFNRGLKDRGTSLNILKKSLWHSFRKKSQLRIQNYLFGHRRRGRLGSRHCRSPGLGSSNSPAIIGRHVLRTENKFLANIFNDETWEELRDGVHCVSYSHLCVTRRWEGLRERRGGWENSMEPQLVSHSPNRQRAMTCR